MTATTTTTLTDGPVRVVTLIRLSHKRSFLGDTEIKADLLKNWLSSSRRTVS